MKIHLFATLRLKCGKGEIELEDPEAGTTIRDIVRLLDTLLELPVYDELIDPEKDLIRPGTMLLLDGTNVHHLEGLDTPAVGARLDVFPPAGGG